MQAAKDDIQQSERQDALGAFAHVGSYDFDYDYRGETTERRAQSPLVDDFDSYMFPDPGALPPASDVTHTTQPSSDAGSSGSSAAAAAAAAAAALTGADVDWAAVDAAVLYAPDGTRVHAADLYNGYSTLVTLVFVPRTSVELCALVYAKLAHLLQQASCRLVFVTAWSCAQALTFLSRFEKVTPFPGAMICDPDAQLFAAFELTRSPLRALLAGGRVSAPMRQGMRNALSTVSYRAANRDIGSTAVSSKRLKAGAVVMPALRGYEKRPHVMYAAEETGSAGVGCYMDVLLACGVNDAFVPDIDVAQLYARFNSMRVTCLKARVADEKEANRVKSANRASRKSERRNALKT